MLKRILCLVVFLIGLAATASASEEEWISRSFDFSKPQRIFIMLNSVPPNIRNGITDNRVTDIFYADVAEKVAPKLTGHHKILTYIDAANFMRNNGIDLPQLFKTNPQEANKLLVNFIVANCDLVVSLNLLKHDYVMEGYYPVAYAYVYFEVVDMHSGNKIWTKVDSRFKNYGDPTGMYSRILDKFFSDFVKKLSKNSKP